MSENKRRLETSWIPLVPGATGSSHGYNLVMGMIVICVRTLKTLFTENGLEQALDIWLASEGAIGPSQALRLTEPSTSRHY